MSQSIFQDMPPYSGGVSIHPNMPQDGYPLLVADLEAQVQRLVPQIAALTAAVAALPEDVVPIADQEYGTVNGVRASIEPLFTGMSALSSALHQWQDVRNMVSEERRVVADARQRRQQRAQP